MNRRTKNLILFFSFIGLTFFFFQPIVKIGSSKIYMVPPDTSRSIDINELNDFLSLWSRVMQSSMRHSIEQMSLKSDQKYPSNIVHWLNAQNWNEDRFFYNEQRLKDILGYIDLERSLKNNLLLEKNGNESIREIISTQQESLKKCPYTKEEVQLIEENYDKISSVLSGNAILKK